MPPPNHITRFIRVSSYPNSSPGAKGEAQGISLCAGGIIARPCSNALCAWNIARRCMRNIPRVNHCACGTSHARIITHTEHRACDTCVEHSAHRSSRVQNIACGTSVRTEHRMRYHTACAQHCTQIIERGTVLLMQNHRAQYRAVCTPNRNVRMNLHCPCGPH